MSTDPLIQAFFDEAAELVVDFEASLLRLEEAPQDVELLNRIFRSAHTLKGNSAMMGFEAIAHFTHALEDLLDQLRKGKRPVTPRAVNALLASGDVVRGMLEAARNGRTEATADEATARDAAQGELRVLLGGAPEPPPPAAAVPAPPAAPPPAEGARTLYEIEFRPPADLLRRGLDPQAIANDVGRLGEVVQVSPLVDGLPPLEELDPERAYLGWRIWLLSTRPQTDVEACFEFVAEPSAVRIDALPMDNEPAPAQPSAADAVAAEPAPAAVATARRAAATGAVAEAASIRVAVEKVDRLINLVGELVISQSMVAQTVSAFTPDKMPALVAAVAQMDRHARELHERMMAVRMVPIKTLFGRFPRVVRDLVGANGKQVTLELSGEDTELDKTVIEKIGDPLTHLVRNAVDHGLESPDDRQMAGKPPTGRLILKAYQQGGNIYIEVVDDGRGLDRDKIQRKALAQGLIAADEALSDDAVFALIFRAGFSTADTITEISGRGVGLDVVRQNVDALGGSISISTEIGAGTTFRIKLPLTLAIVDGQLLRVGDRSYVLPLISIVESVRPRREQLNRVLGEAETIRIRDRVLPMLRLHRVFDVIPQSEDATDGLVVVVEQDGRHVALLVDELLAQQQVVIKSLEQNFEKVRGVAGATILGDGGVTLILDVPGLLALAREGHGASAGAGMTLVAAH